MNYTKGPWNVGSYAVNDYNLGIYANDGTKVAETEEWLREARPECESNASLISAAPEGR